MLQGIDLSTHVRADVVTLSEYLRAELSGLKFRVTSVDVRGVRPKGKANDLGHLKVQVVLYKAENLSTLWTAEKMLADKVNKRINGESITFYWRYQPTPKVSVRPDVLNGSKYVGGR